MAKNTLSEALQEMRRLGGSLREAVTTPDGQKLISCSKLWRNVTRQGDNLLEAVQNVVDSMESAVGQDYPQRRNADLIDVRTEIGKVKEFSGALYNDFAQGRGLLYEVAALWEINTRRQSPKRVASTDLNKQDVGQILDGAQKSAQRLMSSVGDMLESGAKASALMVKCAKSGCPVAMRKEVITAGLDFRDLVSESLFARVTGVVRRAAAMIERYQAEMDESVEWKPPWADDPEIGPGDMV